MENKTKYKVISLILWLIIVQPIWYYLLYNILEYIKATQLMWFLYYVYVPISILVTILAKVGSDD